MLFFFVVFWFIYAKYQYLCLLSHNIVKFLTTESYLDIHRSIMSNQSNSMDQTLMLTQRQRLELTLMPRLFSGLPKDDIHAWLCKEAHEVAGYLSQIHTYRNSLVLINCIPQELLVHIFHHVISSYTGREYHNTLENITHVCRNWRDVTTQCPKFWSRIYASGFSQSRMDHYLTLSKDNALDLTMKYEDPNFYDRSKMHLFDGAIPRLGSLTLNIHQKCLPLQKFLRRLSKKQPPTSFNSLEINDALYCCTAEMTSNLPESLRPMRALHLKAIKIPFSDPAWNNLVSIELLGLDQIPRYQPYTISDLLDVLKRCPDLKTLRVIDSPIRIQETRHSSTVGLDKLRCLEFKDSSEAISTFMEHVSVPASAAVVLHPTGVARPSEFDYRSNVLPFDLSAIAVLYSIDKISLRSAQDPEPKFILSGTSKSHMKLGGSFVLNIPCSEESVKVSHSGRYRTTFKKNEHTKNHLTKTIPRIFQTSISNLRELSISGCFSSLTTECWFSILGDFHNIEYISLRSYDKSHGDSMDVRSFKFLEAISEPFRKLAQPTTDGTPNSLSQQCSDASSPEVLCPKLRILCLRLLNRGVGPTFWEVILESLRRRKGLMGDNGRKLERLHLWHRSIESVDDVCAAGFEEVTERFSSYSNHSIRYEQARYRQGWGTDDEEGYIY
ncbi:hypothetical protein C8Q75DRAFT_753223 [Abortiporus biennis]|nr:hypothetical protein C8Q75DRAFT_753223 [Abortiporus biennis]